MLRRTVTGLSKFLKDHSGYHVGLYGEGSEKVITVDKAREGSGGTAGEMGQVQGIFWRQQDLVYKLGVVGEGKRVIPRCLA